MAKNFLALTNFCLKEEDQLLDWMMERVGREAFRTGSVDIRTFFAPVLARIRQRQQEKKLRVVTIGGTNGKGETIYHLAHLCQSAGLRAALWISPHVFSLRERIAIHGRLITNEELHHYLQQEYERMEAYPFRLSFYELLLGVFCAFVGDRLEELDLILLEVGLGGRLDGVNLFEPDLTAITSISRDHQNLLGPTYRSILGEKLGITRVQAPLLTAFELNYLQEQTAHYCQERGIGWRDLFREGILSSKDHFSTRNRLLAFNLYAHLRGATLGLPDAQTAALMESYAPKGRQEVWSLGAHQITFIGSHNSDGVRKMIDYYERYCKVHGQFTTLLVSFSKRNEVHEVDTLFAMIANSQIAQKILFTTFDHFKSMHLTKDQFQALQQRYARGRTDIEWVQDWQAYFQQLWQTPQPQQSKHEAAKILVTGSFYFVGTVQRFCYPVWDS